MSEGSAGMDEKGQTGSDGASGAPKHRLPSKDAAREKSSLLMQDIMDDAMKVLKKRQQAVTPSVRKAEKIIQLVPTCERSLRGAVGSVLPSIQKSQRKTPQPVPSADKAPKSTPKVVLPAIQKTLKRTPRLARSSEKIPKSSHKIVLPTAKKSEKKAAQPALDYWRRSFEQQQHGTHGSQEHPYVQKNQPVMRFVHIPQDHQIFLKKWSQYLTDFEKEEVKQYKEVWYFGKRASNKIHGSTDPPCNYGYDSSLGYYNTVIRDHLAYRYEVLKELGRQTGGTVLKCKDHKTKEKVAIKVIRNIKRSVEAAQCELEMLELLHRIDPCDRANIVHMKDSFVFRNHICIIFELFEKNFEMVLACRITGKLSMEETKHYAIDLLKCLLLLKEAGIVHGDLKPGNMLLSKKGTSKHAKVIDFGGSYLVSATSSPKVMTYAYAAPEVLLAERCDTSSDMWSLGCILIEMFTGNLIFGENEKNTFQEIMKVLRFSVKELIQLYPRQERFFGYLKTDAKQEPKNECKGVAAFMNTKDTHFLDFIQCCLEFDPSKRMTPKEALRHPWIRKQRKKGIA